MTLRTRLAVGVALALLTAKTAQSQAVDTIAEPRDSAKIALVNDLMRVANIRQQLISTMRETSTRQTLPVPPGFWDLFIARAEQDVDELIAPIVADYARYFSTADLRALRAFYASPAGLRLSKVAPVMTANSSLHGQQWGLRVGADIAAQLTSSTKPSMTPSTTKPTKP
jgi:hypothetical protein